MKNIETIVTDLETSKALQEAGIECETAFVWVKDWRGKNKLILRKDLSDTKTEKQIIPAYTAGEMMKGLPKRIDEKKGLRHISPHLHMYYDCADNFVCGYGVIGGDDDRDFVINSKRNSKLPHKALSALCQWVRKEGYL